MKKIVFNSITCLLVIISVFFFDVNRAGAITSTNEVKYTMQKDKEIIKDSDGKIRGIVYFQYPIVEGNSESIHKINDTLKNASKEYMSSETAQRLKEYTDGAIENNGFWSENEQYYYKTTCKVTYNDNEVFGLHMKMSWYAGGVYNQTDYGYTFDVTSGELLGLKDVISGEPTEIKKKIWKAAKEYLKSNGSFDNNAYSIIRKYKLKDYKFYLGKEKVYLCFESYELMRGTGWDIFSLKSKFE